MKMRGGQLLVRSLQEKGVTQVFTLSGYPGAVHISMPVDHYSVW